MAKLVEYDVSGVEASGGGGTEQPKQGIYTAKIVQCKVREEKADGSPANDIMVAFDLGADYTWVYTYIGLSEAADWKLAEFTRSLGLKEKGKFDPDKLVGKIIRLKINPDTYEGEYRGRVGRLMQAGPKDDILPSDGAGPTDDDEAEATNEESETIGSGGAFTPTREDPEDEDVGAYEDWEDDDLEAEVEDRGVTVGGGRGKKRDKWIKALRLDDESADDEPEGEEEGEAEEEGDEYDEWDVKELTAEAKDRELEMPKKTRGSNAEERLRVKLIELLRADDQEEPF